MQVFLDVFEVDVKQDGADRGALGGSLVRMIRSLEGAVSNKEYLPFTDMVEDESFEASRNINISQILNQDVGNNNIKRTSNIQERGSRELALDETPMNIST